MEQYTFSDKEQIMIEKMPVPMAVYQFVNGKVLTLAITEGYISLFDYPDFSTAYRCIREDAFCNTHPDDLTRIMDAAYRFAKEGGRYEVIFRSRKYGGSAYHIVHGIGEHIHTEEGVRLAIVWYTDEGTYSGNKDSQASALNRAFNTALKEESILRASYYNYLTGLPSMSYFFELAAGRKTDIMKEGGRPALLYLDLRGMKRFNTKYGFSEGDALLKEFAQCLRMAFPDDVCSHFGADHFIVIAETQGIKEKLDVLFEQIRGLNDGKNLPVHAGIYQWKDDEISVTEACDRAKSACDTLKHTYSSTFVYYDQRIQDEEEKRQYIIENFDKALSEKWIRVYLQPIIRAVNEQVCDVEALARWVDPVKGVLSPAGFIPVLEEAGLIYKLDLYMLEQILELIKIQKAEGFYIVPHSINLSRADFDACDIVEEIRKRVDEAGIDRDRITIEVTESVIGSDFEFMKEQVRRFQELGFPVWMDDFGSGYSSLDILQSIRFDLIKFDMSFMRKLDEGEAGKIVLTELMKMANSLGVGSVCEGVETEEQVRFLLEIGCSKLQGFYFSKPISFEAIREMHENRTLIANENPDEAEYYEILGRVNLYDLGVITDDEEKTLRHTFSTIPIAILEINGDTARYARSNSSYRYCSKRFFNFDILNDRIDVKKPGMKRWATFVSAVKQCIRNGRSVFFDETVADGSVFHFFARRLRENPVTGGVSVIISVLSISEPDESTTYEEIAKALAADYYNIYIIDLDTNDYTEYSSKAGGEELSIERRGVDFFESARRDTMTRIYEEDREQFLALFTREKVLQDLDIQGAFSTTYRLIDTGTPMYVNMKITRMKNSNRLILGVSIIDAHMKQKEHYNELQKERETLVRVMALSDGYLSLFTVDPKTGKYVEYSSSEDFDSLGAAKDGDDFFGQAYIDAFTHCYEPDRKRFQEQVTLENVMREVRLNGVFKIDYRLIIRGEPRPVTLKAALFSESGEEKLVVGVRAWRERVE